MGHVFRRFAGRDRQALRALSPICAYSRSALGFWTCSCTPPPHPSLRRGMTLNYFLVSFRFCDSFFRFSIMHIRRDYPLVPLLLSVHKQAATEVCRQGFYYRWKTLAILGFVRSKFPANFCQCVQGGNT